MRYITHRLLQRLVLPLLLIAPARARAQATPAGATRRMNSCLEHLPPSVFTRVAVYATLQVGDSVSPTFAATADNLVQDLVIRAQKLLGAKPNTLPDGEPSIDWRGVDDDVHLTAFRDGRIIAKNPSPGASAAAFLARALKEDSTPGLLEFSADSARDSISFDIRFVRPTLDSAGYVSKPHVKRAAVPFVSVLAPWERPVSHKSGEAPHYPAQARDGGFEGTVILSFIVDSTGRAVDSTVKEVSPTGGLHLSREKQWIYDSFVASVRSAVRDFQFVPASIGGCPVNQLVQMPFHFELRR